MINVMRLEGPTYLWLATTTLSIWAFVHSGNLVWIAAATNAFMAAVIIESLLWQNSVLNSIGHIRARR